ncbi:MAG: tetratricopeptide repeat protein [Planctomycetota bacterium]
MTIRHGSRLLLFLLLATGTLAAQAVPPRSYGDWARDLARATRDGDWEEALVATEGALALRPDYPLMLFSRAEARAHLGRPVEALADLERIAAMGVSLPVEKHFAKLLPAEKLAPILARLRETTAARGKARLVVSGGPRDFIPEGYAWDAKRKRHLLGGIHLRSIIALSEEGEVSTLVAPEQDGLWSVGGLAVDARNDWIWCASTAMVAGRATPEAVAGRAAIFAFELGTGKLAARHLLPEDGRPHALGDLLVADDAIYASDARTGQVWRLDRKSGEYRVLVREGLLESPQGMVFVEEGRAFVVASYRGPLKLVRLPSGAVSSIAHPEDVCMYGIDGLAAKGRQLVAIQNGIEPHRVVTMTLAEDLKSVSGFRILCVGDERLDEPTLGAVVGNEFRFVANSHWPAVGRTGTVRGAAKLSPPTVLAVDLP